MIAFPPSENGGGYGPPAERDPELIARDLCRLEIRSAPLKRSRSHVGANVSTGSGGRRGSGYEFSRSET